MARYLVAGLLLFPEELIKQSLPQIPEMTAELSAEAGCPLSWTFLSVLPLMSMPCSTARLWINELFLVPPLIWIGLALDSGANKSGIMIALSDIAAAYEGVLLNLARTRGHNLDVTDNAGSDCGEEDSLAEAAPTSRDLGSAGRASESSNADGSARRDSKRKASDDLKRAKN